MTGVAAFTGRYTVREYYERAVVEATMTLNNMSDDKVLANDDQELQEYFEAKSKLYHLEEDESAGGPSGKRSASVAQVVMPLRPRPSNFITIQLKAEAEWPIRCSVAVAADHSDHVE